MSGALVIAALVGGTVIGSAFAADPTPTPTTAATDAAGPYCQVYRQAFAANLGVSQDKLTAAAKAAIATTVDKAVADGTITAAAGERIKARAADAPGDGCGLLRGRGGAIGRAALGIGANAMTAAADALDMTLAELRTALRAGSTLKEVAAAEGVPYTTVTQAVTKAVKADVDAAVAAGTITQARADQILARLADRLAEGRIGGGMGRGHGRGAGNPSP